MYFKEQFINKVKEVLESGVNVRVLHLEIHRPTGNIEHILTRDIEDMVETIKVSYNDNLYDEIYDSYIHNYTFITSEDNDLFDFGDAITALRHGNKVARKGWNGKGMYVVLNQGQPLGGQCTEQAKKLFGEDILVSNPYFVIKNVNKSISTWVPSVNDCLAEDWYIVSEVSKNEK